jgi:GNAT superfamily N-acetyltransferase
LDALGADRSNRRHDAPRALGEEWRMVLEADSENFSCVGLRRAQQGNWSPDIRAVDISEMAEVCAHLRRLGPDCRRARFGCEVSDAFLAGYSGRVDCRNTLIFGFFEAGELRGIAELRSLRQGWCPEAEAAFSVEYRWQRKGIGTALMTELVLASPELGIEHIYLSCHVRNRPMLRIAEKAAAVVRVEEDECFADIRVRREPASLY